MPRIVDRYLFRAAALRFVAVVAVVIALLSLDNVARLAADLQHTDAPVRLLARLSLSLVPEHLAAALPIATLLSVALSARDLSLRGEWQMLAASGMSPWRIMAAPMALATLAAGLQVADRLELRPWGLCELDALYGELKAGLHGGGLALGQPVPLADGATLVARAADRRTPGTLSDVLVRRGAETIAAPAARVASDGRGGIAITLLDGVSVHRAPDGSPRRLRFASFRVTGAPPTIGLVEGNARHQLDRLDGARLWRRAAAEAPGTGRAATAALVSRVESALFCLILPWLGVSLGVQPRRRQGGAAVLFGIALIVLHFQSAAFVEDHCTGWAVTAGVLHLLAWVGGTAATVRRALRGERGLAESAWRWLRDRWTGGGRSPGRPATPGGMLPA